MNATTARTALLLDGRVDDDPTLALVHEALADGLAAGGWAVHDWRLRDEKIAWCTGCFNCWVKTPGVCAHNDAGREVAARIARSDLLVYLTPVTFGGYSSELKKALDHAIPILQPFLRKSGADTRHPQRYERRRDLLAVGTVPAGQAGGAEARTFRRLVERNTLNLQPPRWAAGVLESGAGDWEVRVSVGALLAEVGVVAGVLRPALCARGGRRMRTPRTALLLIGSPKTGASTSASLGAYLLEELEKRGLRTQAVALTKALRSEEATEELHSAVAAADLVVLSFPLYVDSLPAPVIRALELIGARRAGALGDADDSVAEAAGKPALVAICQCGFPEAEHNEVALEICAGFARSAGFEWAGGLAMGAGGMVSEQPLRKVAGRLRSVVRALDLSAAELAAGRTVPDEAVRLMAKPAFPAFAYRFIANRGWRSELKKRGAGTPLDARPFA